MNNDRKGSDQYTVFTPPSMDVRERIIHFLLDNDEAFTPKTIAEALEVPANTVRARLSELKDANEVYQPQPRKYAIVPGYGVEYKPPRMQNLRFVCENVNVDRHEVFVICGSDALGFPEEVKITVEAGKKLNRVNYVLAAPWGIDHLAFSLIHKVVEQELVKRGYRLGDWFFVSGEFLYDFFGLTLRFIDGIEIESFDGVLEKIYSKENFTRYEIKVNKEIAFDEFQRMLNKGLLVHTQFRLTHEIYKKLVDIENALKYNNRAVDQIVTDFIKFLTKIKQ